MESQKSKPDANKVVMKTYIVEHLDEELGSWSELEYTAIADEALTGRPARFCLSALPSTLAKVLPPALLAAPALIPEIRSVEELYPDPDSRTQVCLLDPAAQQDLEVEDGDRFDIFLFGGILGTP